MPAFDDISGNRYGRLTAKHRDGKKWLCICDCGKEKLFNPSNLKRGLTKSCGCLNRESVVTRFTRPFQWRKIPEYKIWQGIIQRCENANDKDYNNYGGRGIRVCDAWHTFDCFLSDMGPRPSKEFSIDRVEVNGSYELTNCRWATKTEQARNRRNNLIVEVDGKKGCLVEFIPQGCYSPEYARAQYRVKRGLDF